MSNTFKRLTPDDRTSLKTLINEQIPITGSIVSGTYGGDNIKNYSHKMFQSVHDYPYLSSSANAIFDITAGYSSNSGLSSSANTDNSKKINIYNEMAKVLVGHDITGSILNFDQDGDIIAGGTKLKECVFIPFSRLLIKDEIKKGTFELKCYDSGSVSAPERTVTINDSGAASSFKTNSPAGEYGLLVSSSVNVGAIYYQAGVAVLTSSVISKHGFGDQDQSWSTVEDAMVSGTIEQIANGVRNRLENIEFNNVTEINSTAYFIRVNHNEFNYSSNPTYLSGSKIRNKDAASDPPSSYITTVGLYSPDNALIAVAKTSEPIKKSAGQDLTLRVRVDY